MSKKKKRRKKKKQDSYQTDMRRLVEYEGKLHRHEYLSIKENIRRDKKRRKDYIV